MQGASPAQPRPTAPAGGTLRFGLGDDPHSIDPRLADDEPGLLVVDALFDSLTAHGRNQFPVPSAAASWIISEDQLTWTFVLAPQGRFHDGSPVVSTDFVRAFGRIADGTSRPRSFQAHLLRDVLGFAEAQQSGGPLAGVSAPDDHTLVIQLIRPNADFASVLAHPSLAPVPPSADEVAGWAESPIGNGPFAMVEPWAHNQFIRLARVADSASLDEIIFRIYADDPNHAQQYLDFGAGQLHVAVVPPTELAIAERTYGSAGDGEDRPGVLDGPSATTYNYGFNTARAPFDRAAVRQAASLVMDREFIADDIMVGTRDAADALLPPGIVGRRPGTCQWCRHDPEAARALLAEAQVILDPEALAPLVLAHPPGRTHARIAEHVAGALHEELGFEVEVRPLGLQAFHRALAAGEVDLFPIGWSSEHPLPSSFLAPLFHQREIPRDNVMRFADPEVDRLLDEAAATLDRRTRVELGQAAEDRVADLSPLTPLLTYRLQRVVASDVRGFRMDALGRVDLAKVSLVTAP